jgi:Family of unknown function (DUF5926)
MASKTSVEFVLRPFEGLPGEADWVALREVVPSATATVRTRKAYGARDVVIATVLPAGWPALHRADGVLLVALQAIPGSGDASRDIAANLIAGGALEPGNPLEHAPAAIPGPRLQDVLEPSDTFEVTVHDGFDFWLAPDADVSAEAKASLDEANATVVPTVKLTGVESAYWCRMGDKEFLRWAMPHEEEKLLDALARLHARREATLGAGTRLVGAFRSCGIVVPVWDLVPGTEAADIEQPTVAFQFRLEAALADDAPLDGNERRARAGLVSRQLTLR